MRLSTGLSTHFSAFDDYNTANVNMAMFSDTMEAKKLKMEKINNLMEDKATVVLVKIKHSQIKALHGFKKFSGT
jgi:hypothetical protein